MNGAIGIDYAEADALLERLNAKKTEISTLFDEINGEIVSQLRRVYEGAAGEAIATSITSSTQRANEAIDQMITQIKTRMDQDKADQQATDQALANAQ